MIGETVHLDRDWLIGQQIGQGGFGQVFEAECEGELAAAKFIPKALGAERDLLLVDLADAINVVPIIDSGEHADTWVLVMPRAEGSLRDYLLDQGGSLPIDAAVRVLSDISAALTSLEGRVVHRDLKPENILLLDATWCLADFGISRFAEATTARDTKKYALSPPYAAPERWRLERATTATDIYAVGVIAFEILAGRRPFPGPAQDDYQSQHLNDSPPNLPDVPAALASAIQECLLKAPGARPTPQNLHRRLERALTPPSGPGAALLTAADHAQMARRVERDRQESRRRIEVEARSQIAAAGRDLYGRISESLLTAIRNAAPSARIDEGLRGHWVAQLGSGTLSLTAPEQIDPALWGEHWAPQFDVALASELNLRIPPNRTDYEGRSHSLWYCDADQEGNFEWFETAFWVSPVVGRRGRQNPFSRFPSEDVGAVLSRATNELAVAWPFTRLTVGDLDEFIDRWTGWFALAAQGQLAHPSRMPERGDPPNSFRRR